MVGFKSSLKPLLKLLQKENIVNVRYTRNSLVCDMFNFVCHQVRTTRFEQGKTMRWAIAWSFYPVGAHLDTEGRQFDEDGVETEEHLASIPASDKVTIRDNCMFDVTFMFSVLGQFFAKAKLRRARHSLQANEGVVDSMSLTCSEVCSTAMTEELSKPTTQIGTTCAQLLYDRVQLCLQSFASPSSSSSSQSGDRINVILENCGRLDDDNDHEQSHGSHAGHSKRLRTSSGDDVTIGTSSSRDSPIYYVCDGRLNVVSSSTAAHSLQVPIQVVVSSEGFHAVASARTCGCECGCTHTVELICPPDRVDADHVQQIK
jgi:hypothetical protein